MSGPKTGTYTLTAEELKRIQEEIERQLKIMAARGKLNSRIAKVNAMIDEVDVLIAKNISRSGLSGQVMQLQKLRNNAINVVAAVSVAGDTEDLNVIDAQSGKLKLVHEELSQVRVELEEASEELEGKIEEQKNATFANIRGISFRNVGRKVELKKIAAIDRAMAVINNIDTRHLPKEFIAQINGLRKQLADIDDEGFAENFYAMSVKPLAKQCSEYSIMYEQYIEEYETLSAEYVALAASLSMTAESIGFNEQAIAVLKTKIAELKDISVKHNEQVYVSKCIDEAMEEMGYNLVGNREVVKKNGRKLRHELYLFDEGTAVDVTYASNGQISMELGGLDSEDRTPSNAEAKELADSMETFCGAYAELEKRLLKKGIVTKRISVLPPDEQYAQIINTEDYDMVENVTNFEAKTSKRQAGGKSTLHKEL